MRAFLRYAKKRPLALVSLIILCVLYITMIFAEFVAPYDKSASFESMTYCPPNITFIPGGGSLFQAQEHRVVNAALWKYARVKDAYAPVKLFVTGGEYRLFGIIPSRVHLFGTENGTPAFLLGADNLGRDLFSRIVFGSRISLTIGFAATALSLVLAILLGGFSGYFGGGTDWAIMRLSEFFMLVPGLYLILFLRSLLSTKMDTGQSYMVITLILSLVGWPGSARTIRGLAHSIKREDFVLNAELEGMGAVGVIFKHIIPQMASLLIVSCALSVPGFIMSETTLSYLGLGIADPAVSWGSLIKREVSTLNNLRNYPWLLNPVWLLLIVTLAFNFVADSLRDFYDPYHTIHAHFWERFKKKERSKTSASPAAREPDSPFQSFDQGADGKSISAVLPGSPLCDSPPSPLLEVRNLRVTFPPVEKSFPAIQAVRGVSFTLSRGEILGIVGESGSGKSVTAAAIPRLCASSALIEGEIRFDGVNLTTLDVHGIRMYRGKRIGMIFQEPSRSYDPLQRIDSAFFETFRVARPDITKEESDSLATDLLDEMGITESRRRLSGFPHQFSGGQLQRIGIALALAGGCELLLADEPTTALDVTIQAQIVKLLKELRSRRGISIIFISHNIDVVSAISDRIMVMYAGLVMEEGKTEKMIHGGAAHPYTRALLDAAPRFGQSYRVARLRAIAGKVPDPRYPESGCPFSPRCPRALDRCRKAPPPPDCLNKEIL